MRVLPALALLCAGACFAQTTALLAPQYSWHIDRRPVVLSGDGVLAAPAAVRTPGAPPGWRLLAGWQWQSGGAPPTVQAWSALGHADMLDFVAPLPRLAAGWTPLLSGFDWPPPQWTTGPGFTLGAVPDALSGGLAPLPARGVAVPSLRVARCSEASGRWEAGLTHDRSATVAVRRGAWVAVKGLALRAPAAALSAPRAFSLRLDADAWRLEYQADDDSSGHPIEWYLTWCELR